MSIGLRKPVLNYYICELKEYNVCEATKTTAFKKEIIQ